MIKTATIFLIGDTRTNALLDTRLQRAVPEPTIGDPDKTQWNRAGFSKPDYFGTETVFVGANGAAVFNVQVRERVLPGKVIKTRVLEKKAELEPRQSRKIGRKELMEIKDDMVAELLPTAFIKPTDTLCLITGDYLIIGTGSAKLVDTVLAVLRGAFPDETLHFKPISASRRVETFLTDLLLGGSTDSELFNCGDTVTLRDAKKSVVRYKSLDLHAEDIKDRVAQGMRPIELSVEYNERLAFAMTDQMIIKRLLFSDILLKQAAEDAGDGGAVERFDATVAIVAGELRSLLRDLLADIPLNERQKDEKPVEVEEEEL